LEETQLLIVPVIEVIFRRGRESKLLQSANQERELLPLTSSSRNLRVKRKSS
jgi:hypothetical protein